MTIREQLLEHLLFWESALGKIFGGRDRARMLVRIRDDFTCQSCGAVRDPLEALEDGKRMFDVHHVGGFCGKGREYKYDGIGDIWKMITLCHRCHFQREDHAVRTHRTIY